MCSLTLQKQIGLMNQNNNADPNESVSRNNVSESMIDESLPQANYSMSENNLSRNEDELNRTDYSSIGEIDQANGIRIDVIRKDFNKQRRDILNKIGLTSKDVISVLTKNSQIKNELDRQTQDLNRLLAGEKSLTQQNKKLIQESEYLDSEISLRQQFNDFKVRIGKILELQPFALNLGEPSEDVKSILVSKLQERTKPVLDKLRPYLQEYKRMQEPKCKELQRQKQQLGQIDRKIYDHEVQRLQTEINQNKAVKILYDLQDQIENEKNYGNQLDKYISRNENDIKFRNSRFN